MLEGVVANYINDFRTLHMKLEAVMNMSYVLNISDITMPITVVLMAPMSAYHMYETA